MLFCDHKHIKNKVNYIVHFIFYIMVNLRPVYHETSQLTLLNGDIKKGYVLADLRGTYSNTN